MEQLQSTNGAQAAVCGVSAYALGCFATGYYLVRARTGRDLREVDSGSVGARNVSRVLGKPGFVLTMLGDIGKGALAVWAARYFTGNDLLTALALLAVVAGHIWPLQLHFRGGKGAATSLGALLIYDPQLTLVYVVIFIVGFVILRKTILPALFAFACLPVASFGLRRDGLKMLVITLLAALVLFAHRKNFVEEIAALATRHGLATKPQPPKL